MTKTARESGLRRGEERRFAAERRSHTSSAESPVLFSPEAASRCLSRGKGPHIGKFFDEIRDAALKYRPAQPIECH
jgi:hypothetical protein